MANLLNSLSIIDLQYKLEAYILFFIVFMGEKKGTVRWAEL